MPGDIQAESKVARLAWSFMHEDETLLCPFPERAQEALRLAELCQIKIDPQKEIAQQAHLFQLGAGLTGKDALHVACATFISAAYFLTCDDRLLKQTQRLQHELAVLNPVDYVRLLPNSGN